jgi:hypothetical protein
VAAVAQALSHPMRVDLVRTMEAQDPEPLSAVQYTRACEDAKLGSVSYHFKVLRELEVAEVIRTEARRGAIENMHALSGRRASRVKLVLGLLG